MPILRDAFPVPLQMWSNPRKVGICVFSAETFLIPVAGNYPSAFTMDKAPSHMAPQGGRGGCWPSPASDSCHWSVLSSNDCFGEQTWIGECVPNHSRAGRCGWAWQRMLEYRSVLGRDRKWHSVWRRENSQGQGEAWHGIVQEGHARSSSSLIFPSCAAGVTALHQVPCLLCMVLAEGCRNACTTFGRSADGFSKESLKCYCC